MWYLRLFNSILPGVGAQSGALVKKIHLMKLHEYLVAGMTYEHLQASCDRANSLSADFSAADNTRESGQSTQGNSKHAPVQISGFSGKSPPCVHAMLQMMAEAACECYAPR